MSDHLFELVAPSPVSRGRLARKFGPGFDARRDVDAVGLGETRQAFGLQNRQRGFHHIPVAPALGDLLDDVHRLVEANAKVRDREKDEELRMALGKEAKISQQPVPVEGYEFRVPVDAKRAIVGAADAGHDRHGAGGAPPLAAKSRDLDVGHPFFDTGKLGRRPAARNDRRRIDMPAQDVVKERAVAFLHDDVEEPRAIGREGARVRSAQNRERPRRRQTVAIAYAMALDWV